MAKAIQQNGRRMAISHNKHSKLFKYLGIIIQKRIQFGPFRFIERREAPLTGIFHNQGNSATFGVCKLRFNKPILLQDADSHEPVEPSVGGLFGNLTQSYLRTMGMVLYSRF